MFLAQITVFTFVGKPEKFNKYLNTEVHKPVKRDPA